MNTLLIVLAAAFCVAFTADDVFDVIYSDRTNNVFATPDKRFEAVIRAYRKTVAKDPAQIAQLDAFLREFKALSPKAKKSFDSLLFVAANKNITPAEKASGMAKIQAKMTLKEKQEFVDFEAFMNVLNQQ